MISLKNAVVCCSFWCMSAFGDASGLEQGTQIAFSPNLNLRLDKCSLLDWRNSKSFCNFRSHRVGVSRKLAMQADLPPTGASTSSNEIDWRGLEQVGDDWVRYGPKLEEANRNEEDLPEPRWYIVQCTPGLEDNVKMVLHSKINNSPWLQKTILEVLVPTTKVSKVDRRARAAERALMRRWHTAAGTQQQAHLSSGEAHARLRLDSIANGQGAVRAATAAPRLLAESHRDECTVIASLIASARSQLH